MTKSASSWALEVERRAIMASLSTSFWECIDIDDEALWDIEEDADLFASIEEARLLYGAKFS